MTLANIGRYEIVAELGNGGMGVVYAAKHAFLDGRVAIKLLAHDEQARDRETMARFRQEAIATYRVAHPGIVQVIDFDWHEAGQPYIVMELLDGETLSALIERWREGLPVTECVRYAVMLAGALAAVHAHGIIHRDLKPSNVMLVADPDVPGGTRTKIMDFGIAKVAMIEDQAAAPDDSATHLRTGRRTRLGTPLYSSPEQLVETASVTAASDVYSLGVMLFEMLTGEPPFTGSRVEWQHLQNTPQNLRELRPELPEPICNLVGDMLKKEPSDRPTMSQVHERLSRMELGTPEAFQPLAPMVISRERTTLQESIGVVLCDPPVEASVEPAIVHATESRESPSTLAGHPRWSIVRWKDHATSSRTALRAVGLLAACLLTPTWPSNFSRYPASNLTNDIFTTSTSLAPPSPASREDAHATRSRPPDKTVDRTPAGTAGGTSGLPGVTDARRGRQGAQQILIGALGPPTTSRIQKSPKFPNKLAQPNPAPKLNASTPMRGAGSIAAGELRPAAKLPPTSMAIKSISERIQDLMDIPTSPHTRADVAQTVTP